jgi:hypothetical protein
MNLDFRNSPSDGSQRNAIEPGTVKHITAGKQIAGSKGYAIKKACGAPLGMAYGIIY